MPDYVKSAELRTVTAGSNLLSGDLVLTPDRLVGYVEAQRGILNGETGTVRVSGVVRCSKSSASEVIAAGDRISYNTSTKVVTVLDQGNPASGSIVIGLAVAASGNGVATVDVELNGQGETNSVNSTVKHFRRRCTVAEINAGLTLLPAKAGIQYRMVDAIMISIGGNAATANSVDILATQAASGVKLIAAAVAGLTQSTVARAGATNIAVLADGASFVENDVNTAITIGKTGSNVATATHVDVLLSYVEQVA
jgi:predicted RecA/RadA family phage recombinase